MAEIEKSHVPWKGKTGFINQQMLSEFLTDLHGPIYYIAEPPGMVTAMRKMLVDASVDEDDLRTEEFPGY